MRLETHSGLETVPLFKACLVHKYQLIKRRCCCNMMQNRLQCFSTLLVLMLHAIWPVHCVPVGHKF